MIYVGIDIAKLNHFASAISSDGEILIEPFEFCIRNLSMRFSKKLQHRLFSHIRFHIPSNIAGIQIRLIVLKKGVSL